MTQPSLFISHGAPDVVIAPSEVRSYLIELGQSLLANGKPDAIVVTSAHFETGSPQVVSDPNPEMIYDFGGFAPELYEITYPAPGDADLASQVSALLTEAGISNHVNTKRGYDHGAWTPLKLMFPDADIPVVQLSIQPQLDADHHFKVGKALKSLREKNILVIGSGHITHNLRAVFNAMRGGIVDQEMARKTDEFTDWIADKLTSGETGDLLGWQQSAPYAVENHPTPEHFFPLFTALGAGGEGARAERLHTSKQYGMFVSDVWQFA